MSDVISLIGNTPLIAIRNLHNNPKVKLFLKLEKNNPGGSVKDRAALAMIRSFRNSEEYKEGVELIEATSGNTGIALAMIAQYYNIPITLVMPDNATKERIQIMQSYNAKVVLTPAAKTIEFSREYAAEQVIKKGYFMLNQFANPNNWKAHYNTTGPEIWNDTIGSVTHFVSAIGTSGTIVGVSKFLKEKKESIRIVGVYPESGANIPGIRKWSTSFEPEIFDKQWIDVIHTVTEDSAIKNMKNLAKKEALFCGLSSGGAMAVALELAQTIQEGVIVVVAPDGGERYLSTGIFE